MSQLVQVGLSRIIIDEKRHEQIIVLKEKAGSRQFPIVIGFVEASSIKMHLANVTPPRPLTHDLLLSIIRSFHAEYVRLIIDEMKESTFHAKMELKTAEGETRQIDCRPSDGIATAVRAKADIFVEEDVIARASGLNMI